MSLDLTGHRAVVTGASVGIGAETVRVLAAQGASVAFCARTTSAVDALVAELGDTGTTVRGYTADMADADAVATFCDAVEADFGAPPDILVNNVGASPSRNFLYMTDDEWMELFELNVMAAVRLTRRFLPGMRKAGWGRVVMINTVAAKYPGAALVDYAATKAALAAATKALARKYAADGVLINTVMPGRIRTAMWERTALEIAESRDSTDVEAVFAERANDIPVGRFGTEREIANAVLFLASDMASYIAGATLDVDGGLGSHVYQRLREVAVVLEALEQARSEDAPVGTAITAVAAADREQAGPTQIPKSRYLSPEFAALELEKMWPRVWQIACTVDHVAEPGDYFEYRVGTLSVLIVRDTDGTLRAYQNVCRHRGNQICTGSGQGLTELRCGYHRWCWTLEGQLREVPSRKGFGALRNDDYPLFAASVDTWGPLVFVNLDPDAMPLAEYLEAVPGDAAWLGIDDFRGEVMVTVPVEANWKVVADGFSETYHVQGLHREMIASMDDIDAPQVVWGHTSKSSQHYGVASPRFKGGLDDQTVWDSFIVTQGMRMGISDPCPVPELADGETVTDAIAARVRALAAEKGADLSHFDTEQMLELHQYNLFPNATVLVTPDLLSVICARPGADVEQSEMIMINFRRAASADAPRSRPIDVTLSPDEADFGFVLNADMRIAPAVQRGLRQPGLTHLSLSREECRIINTHRNLDRYLDL